MNSLLVCRDRRGLEIEVGYEPFHVPFKRMRTQQGATSRCPLEGKKQYDSATDEFRISIGTDEQTSSSHSHRSRSPQFYHQNATQEVEQNQSRLSNSVGSVQFRAGGASPNANAYVRTQIQQESCGPRAMMTGDPKNIALDDQIRHLHDSQLDSFANSQSGDTYFSTNFTSFDQTTFVPRFSSADSSRNDDRATYGFREHGSHAGMSHLPNFSEQDHMVAHRFCGFFNVENDYYSPHLDIPPSTISGYGRGRDSLPAGLSIGAGNASSDGRNLSATGPSLLPSTLASVHLSRQSSFRGDTTPNNRFSSDQPGRFPRSEQLRRITTSDPTSLRLLDDNIMALSTSHESSVVRTYLNSYNRSHSAPENIPSRISSYFTAHSRRNRCKDYNTYASVHHPAALSSSLSSDLGNGILDSSLRRGHSNGLKTSGTINGSRCSSPSHNHVSHLSIAPHNLPKTSMNNLDASHQLASSTLLSLGEQLQSSSCFEHSQMLTSTAATTTNAHSNESSENANFISQQEQRKLGETTQASIPSTSENSHLVASASTSPISQIEDGESSFDGTDASDRGNNKGVEKNKKTRTSGQEDLVWEERFEELCKFHEKTGHCSVPARYSENKPLGHWVMTQRRQHTLLIQGKQSALTEERVKRLESIGFVWKVRPDAAESWSVMFEQMKAYKKKFGDCLVPQRYYPNPQLGTWVHTQRRHYKMHEDGKKSSMTEEKIQSLNDIGFVWSAKVPWKPHERSKDGDGSESVESASDDCSNMKADDNDYGKKPTAI